MVNGETVEQRTEGYHVAATSSSILLARSPPGSEPPWP